MANTLFLLPKTWDLCLDASGNIAVATDTYQKAQDIASKCRLFTGDLYFSQSEGIPYLEKVLGKSVYSLALYRDKLYEAAMSIEGVESATVNLNPLNDRLLSGSIGFTDDSGNTGLVGL